MVKLLNSPKHTLENPCFGLYFIADLKVHSGLLLNVVVGQRSEHSKQLLAAADQALVLSRDACLVLDFVFDVVNGVVGAYIEGDGLAIQGPDEDLHTTTKSSCRRAESSGGNGSSHDQPLLRPRQGMLNVHAMQKKAERTLGAHVQEGPTKGTVLLM